MADPEKDQQPRSRYGLFGVLGSMLYLLVVVVVLIVEGKPPPWTEDTNEFGDFLAGVAAPLAFLWLVLGFFQQGEELRLQVKEMSDSVKQATAQSSALADASEISRVDTALAINEEYHRPLAMIARNVLEHFYRTWDRFPYEMPTRTVSERVAPRDRRYDLGDKAIYFRHLVRFGATIQDKISLIDFLEASRQQQEIYDNCVQFRDLYSHWMESLSRINAEALSHPSIKTGEIGVCASFLAEVERAASVFVQTKIVE
ncbi:hypothetical protein [Pyruvatibacter mobilis]|uniref:hypothetical protein n=1 Tax=Pyruvatibacter mobilis TaxID=1712261 RepID=UPI003C7BA6E6